MTQPQPDRKPQILVAGSLAFDHIMDFPGYFKDHILPDKLHVINISFLVERLEKQRGGCAGNIAYTLALLGERARILATAGADFGDYGRFLAERGVDLEAVRIVEEETTASAFITTDRSDSQINGFYPGAMGRARELSLAALAGERAAVAIVSPDDPEAIKRHCAEARRISLPFFFDPSFQVTTMHGDDLAAAAEGAVGLMLNDYEWAVFQDKTGLKGHRVFSLVDMLVLTLGEEGSRILTKDDREEIVPAAPVDRAVDPTGAGDAYRGGFLAGWMRGWELAVCGRMGSVAAAYAVECYGTQRHSYTRKEFEDRYAKHFGDLPS